MTAESEPLPEDEERAVRLAFAEAHERVDSSLWPDRLYALHVAEALVINALNDAIAARPCIQIDVTEVVRSWVATEGTA